MGDADADSGLRFSAPSAAVKLTNSSSQQSQGSRQPGGAREEDDYYLRRKKVGQGDLLSS